MMSADPQARPDARRRRLAFRCWHRGMREMDLLLGRFVDARLADMSDDDVAALEQLLEMPDPELFAWLVGEAPPSAGEGGRLVDEMRAFHRDHPTSRNPEL